MRILVTGGHGFIGRHVCSAAAGRGHEVFALTRSPRDPKDAVEVLPCDLEDPAQTMRVLERVAPDAVIHLAWFTRPGSYRDSVAENLGSLRGSLSLLEALTTPASAHLVLAGTCLEEDPGPAGAAAYPVMKRSLHEVALATHPRHVACAHISYLYGPHEHPQRLIPSIIRSLLREGGARAMPADVQRDMLHVDDVARALLTIAEKKMTGTVPVCSGRSVPIGDVLDLAAAEAGASGGIDYGAFPRPQDAPPPREPLDLQAAGWRQEVDLHTGISTTVRWWRDEMAQ